MLNKVTLEAPDISCNHCLASIEKAVTALPGVRFLAGDAAARRVTLEFDPASAPLASIERAMAEAGYPVEG